MSIISCRQIGQTTIEYVLVLLIVALVIFAALQGAGLEDSIASSGDRIGNWMSEAIADVKK